MGTNFYWHEKPPCPMCERPFDGLHIGKSSAGWVFALRVYPGEGIDRLDDWIARFWKPSSVIKDEYGETLTPEAMVARIAGRAHDLRRSSIDGHRCIGNGPGTWDLHAGEFS